MHYLSENHILLFLLQLFLLLTVAKILGERFSRWGYPALAGEVLTGILLGPTILGRAFPELQTLIFPQEMLQQSMLETVSWIGVLFLLLATGFEVNVSTVWRQGKKSLTIGTVGVLIPIILGCAVFWWFPEEYWGENANRLTFTLFLATAAAISAMAVIARILHDIEILKSDLGLTTLSAVVVNDILGWVIFAFVLGLATQTELDAGNILLRFVGIALFGAVCLTLGSRVVGAVTNRLRETSLPYPASVLTFICCLAMLCGMVTQKIGIHAILGFFLAGIMAGNSPKITERTREIISQMTHAIFVPIFFASIALKIDFVSNFNLFLVATFTTVAIGGKFVGAWAGGILAKLSKSDSFSIGIAHIPGGAMEIILGVLALELGLIPENVFVAIVFAALSSSVAAGPLLAWSIRRRKPVDIGQLLQKGSFVLDLGEGTRWEAIPKLCGNLAQSMNYADAEGLFSAVRTREEIMGTAVEKGIAVPHARLEDIESPVVAFGRSRSGLDWDAPDGLPVHFVFLVLTPKKVEDAQVQILAAIATCMLKKDIRRRVMASEDPEEVFQILQQELQAHGYRS